MNTYSACLAFLSLAFAATLSAQSKDTCGFRVQCHPFDSIFPYYIFKQVSARENGDQYEFYFHGSTPLSPKNRFRRITTDRQGTLLSATDFMFDCPTAIVGQDGTFLCADTTATGIRVSKLASPGDTIWTGVFGQPNFIPRGILDMGNAGVVIAGAQPYQPPTIYYPKGFLLKIDGNQAEEWMTVHDVPGVDGRYSRIVPDNAGGYFVEAVYSASSYNYTWEDGIKFDQNGNLLWQTRLGTFASSEVIGFTSDSDGGLLSTVYGIGPNGPSYSCEFYRLDSAGEVLNNACLTEYMPDNLTYFVYGLSEILPAASGGYLTGMRRATSSNAASPYMFVRFNQALDTSWTKGFDQFIRLSASLPGDAFLGYYLPYFGSDTMGLVKIGANGEFAPCVPVSAHHLSTSNENVRITPNPAMDKLVLSFEGSPLLEGETLVRMIDPFGNIVRERKFEASENAGFELELAGLPDGWYVLQMTRGGKMNVSKAFVISH